jgi:hypothetical protein
MAKGVLGGLKIDQARKLKDLEKENERLKRLAADLNLDMDILEQAPEGRLLSPDRARVAVRQVMLLVPIEDRPERIDIPHGDGQLAS